MKTLAFRLTILALLTTLATAQTIGPTALNPDQMRVPKRLVAGVVVVLNSGAFVVADIKDNLMLVQVSGRWELRALAQSCTLSARDLFICAAGAACGPVFAATKAVATCNGASDFEVLRNGMVVERDLDYTAEIVAGRVSVTFKVPLAISGDERILLKYQAPSPG